MRIMKETRSEDDLMKVKYLYHWTNTKENRDSILENGLWTDSDGFIYLSEKPFNETRSDWEGQGYVFKVKIPDHDNLYYWEDFWCDEDGNEVDDDHQADPDNQYYIYMDEIPKEYVKEIK